MPDASGRLAMSSMVGEAGPATLGIRSLKVALFTMSARILRPSSSSSIWSRSPVCTEWDSAKAFQPCSVYSYLLLFLQQHARKPQRQGGHAEKTCHWML